MINKQVCDNVCLSRFKCSFFFITATTLPQRRVYGRFALHLSPEGRFPTSPHKEGFDGSLIPQKCIAPGLP